MSRQCTICRHPQRVEIDYAIASGTSNSKVASQFSGLSKDMVQRHTVRHLAEQLVKYQGSLDETEAINIMTQMTYINGLTKSILKEAIDSKEHFLALQAIDRVMKQLELQARLLGRDRQQMDVYLSPGWHDIRSVVMKALAPYADARIAVAAALASLEPHHDGTE